MSKRESVLEYYDYELRRCKTPEARQVLLNEYNRQRVAVSSGMANGAADQVAQDTGGVGNEAWQKLGE